VDGCAYVHIRKCVCKRKRNTKKCACVLTAFFPHHYCEFARHTLHFSLFYSDL
jgi:hypothetical protein